MSLGNLASWGTVALRALSSWGAVSLRTLASGRSMSLRSLARRAVALGSLARKLVSLETLGKAALGVFFGNANADFPAVSSTRATGLANGVATSSTLEKAVAVEGVGPVVAGLAGREVLRRARGRAGVAGWRARWRERRSAGDEERGDNRDGLEVHFVCDLMLEKKNIRRYVSVNRIGISRT